MDSKWEELRKDGQIQPYKLAGFMPFTEGTVIEATYIESKIGVDGKGFYILRLTAPATINVRDSESGQGLGSVGDYVGVRKTGATAALTNLEVGTNIRISYRGMRPHKYVKEDGTVENTYRHDIIVERERRS